MKDSKGRWLDIAIWVAAAAVVGFVIYIGYSYWLQRQVEFAASPANRAAANLAQLVTTQPNNPDLRVRYAQALAVAGRTSESVEQFKAALTIKKDYNSALSGLGMLAMAQKDYKTAEGYWLRIIQLRSAEQMAGADLALDQAYYSLGVTYLEMKRYEDAIANLKESLRIRSDASDTHYMLSMAYRALGYSEKQRQELQITLAFEPTNAQANYDLGLLYLRDGAVASAAELFRLSADKAPKGVHAPQSQLDKLAAGGDSATRLAKAESLKSTDASGALVQARIAAALDPLSVPAVRLVARLWDAQKKRTQALNSYQRLLDMEPTDAEALKAVKRLESNGK